MKTTQHTCLHAMRFAVIAAALLTVCGQKDDAAAQETKKEMQTPDSAKTRPGDPKSEQGSAIKTRKASCRCGKLSVTYKGPDPKRITLCHCNSCQLRTGTMFSVQGRFPRGKVKIEGKSTKWTFPSDSGKRVKYRSCDSGGATYHFCPVCGTTVCWDIATAPEFISAHGVPPILWIIKNLGFVIYRTEEVIERYPASRSTCKAFKHCFTLQAGIGSRA